MQFIPFHHIFYYWLYKCIQFIEEYAVSEALVYLDVYTVGP